ncbi:MAG: hypothetical protein HC843_09090 [Sphingomonadales bacterium]|nr:hypothetical protein [Sphingomonadales bacterium]
MKLWAAISLFLALCLPQITKAQDGDGPSKQELYDSFVYCSAYHLAKTEVDFQGEEIARQDASEGAIFLSAAALTDVAESDKASANLLEERVIAIVNEYNNGDEQAKQDFVLLGENCADLRDIAQDVIDEAEGAELTNAI